METALNNIVFPFITALATVLAGYVLNLVRKKLNIQISDQIEAGLQKQAELAALWVEEKAAQKLKENNFKFTSNEKLNQAVEKLLSMSPAITTEQAVHYIELAVAKLPIGANKNV